GATYRLPSEAEWEYSARAGSQSLYHFGDNVTQICEYGNVADLSAQNSRYSHWTVIKCSDGYPGLAPVGKFKPNAFGVYDTIGNLSEWVDDCWHPNFEGAPAQASSWREQNDGDCNQHVHRGGAFSDLSSRLRSAFRYVNRVWDHHNEFGFR